jgi:hypothetical protein
MAKTATRTSTLMMEAASAVGANIRIDVRTINIPKKLREQAEEALKGLITTLPDPITYPIEIPEDTDAATRAIISDLIIQFVSMSEYEVPIPEGGPSCGNGQCMVDEKLVCCPPPPSTIMASVNGDGLTIINKKAFLTPIFFDLKFYDKDNKPLIAYQGTLSEKPSIRFYRVIDEEILKYVEVKVGENYQYLNVSTTA